MDAVRIMVHTNCAVVLNETFRVEINGETFSVKMIEDHHGLLLILAKDHNRLVVAQSSSTES